MLRPGLKYSKENWEDALESLGFREIKNPNGADCYDVLNEQGIPTWQYDDLQAKKKLYYFFCGAVYMKLHLQGVYGR